VSAVARRIFAPDTFRATVGTLGGQKGYSLANTGMAYPEFTCRQIDARSSSARKIPDNNSIVRA
jgi:hypothetical protein